MKGELANKDIRRSGVDVKVIPGHFFSEPRHI